MSSLDSDSDDEKQKIQVFRLGDCEVCGSNKAIYTCPKCEVKTCSLACVRIHKKELECNGIRDRTKFVRMKDFKDMDLLSDYRMLEECARFVYAVKRDEKKKYTRAERDLPIHLYKLKMAARQRGTVLQFLTGNFTRSMVNSTRYRAKSNIIQWRIEWIFPNVDGHPLKFTDPKCQDNKKLSEYLEKYLNPDTPPFEGAKALTFYRAAGFNGVKVLLRAEKIKGSAKKFYELDPSESLAENLSGKCIVEFPIIFVVLKDHAYNFEIVTPEDEIESEKQEKQSTNPADSSNSTSQNSDDSPLRKRPLLLTEIIAEQKKLELEKEIKEDRKKRPKNLLFTTGYSSEESDEEVVEKTQVTKPLTTNCQKLP